MRTVVKSRSAGGKTWSPSASEDWPSWTRWRWRLACIRRSARTAQSQFLLWLVSQEIVDYEKEEEIAGVTDLPEQSAADPSCTRTLSCRA